eukprot:12115149-Alexandrium_andersonii.AAC.1
MPQHSHAESTGSLPRHWPMCSSRTLLGRGTASSPSSPTQLPLASGQSCPGQCGSHPRLMHPWTSAPSFPPSSCQS